MKPSPPLLRALAAAAFCGGRTRGCEKGIFGLFIVTFPKVSQPEVVVQPFATTETLFRFFIGFEGLGGLPFINQPVAPLHIRVWLLKQLPAGPE